MVAICLQLIVIALMVTDLAEHRRSQRFSSAARALQDAERRIRRLTEEAMTDMFEEIRQHPWPPNPEARP